MNKTLFLLLSSSLILSACGNDTSKENTPKSEKHINEKKNDKKPKEKAEINEKEKNLSTDNNDNLHTSTVVNENNQQSIVSTNGNPPTSNNQYIDLSSINNINTLRSVIYGNYSEEQKNQAYNSAVANGILPQGNVFEGYAKDAFESSIRIANGQEHSIYQDSLKIKADTERENAEERKRFKQQLDNGKISQDYYNKLLARHPIN